MRRLVFAFSVLAVLFGRHGTASAQIPDPAAIDRARGLDQQGVRAFREGRFRDAIRFFDEASRLGGPSSEIWNVARCYQRLDEPQDAARTLERYLEQTDLMPSERAEADRELQEIRRRPSQMSIDSDPAGATATVDGKPSGAPTPVGVDIAPGPHHIRIERAGFHPYETDVEASFGRAILVTTKLVPETNSKSAEDPGETPLASTLAIHGPARRFLFSAEVGVFFPRLGSEGSGPRPEGHVAARYVFNPDSRVLVTTGVRFSVLSYGGSQPASLCQLADGESSTELGGLVTGGFSVRALPRVRLGADVGVGVAGLVADASGPGAGKPGCATSYGLAFLAHVGLEASFAVTPAFRLILSPLAFQAHPAFGGAREIPPSTIDTGGLWWRLGSSMGFAFDAK